MRDARLELYTLPDYRPKRGKQNNYGYDPAEQKSQTYTGMGMDINVHDNWAVESPGPIHDRSTENLGTTDKAIIANRRLLMQSIDAAEAGRDLPVTLESVSGPVAVDTIATDGDWQAHWRRTDQARRNRSAWAKPVPA